MDLLKNYLILLHTSYKVKHWPDCPWSLFPTLVRATTKSLPVVFLIISVYHVYIWLVYREIHLSPASPTISAECCALADILPNGLVGISVSKTKPLHVWNDSAIHVGFYLHIALPGLSSDETCPIVACIVMHDKDTGCVSCSPRKPWGATCSDWPLEKQTRMLFGY